MTLAAILSALVSLLEASPSLITAVEDVIAAFKGGGATAAKAMLASQHAQETAALEQQLETPIK